MEEAGRFVTTRMGLTGHCICRAFTDWTDNRTVHQPRCSPHRYHVYAALAGGLSGTLHARNSLYALRYHNLARVAAQRSP